MSVARPLDQFGSIFPHFGKVLPARVFVLQ